LIANCDEFIYYDDLVRRQPTRTKESEKEAGRRPARSITTKAAKPVKDKKQEALDLIAETYEALVEERGEGEKIWGSMVKQTLKRRKPGFNESYYGFGSFGELLEEAQSRGILELEPEEKSGGYIIRGCHKR
jgi:hypothetical protein